MTITSTHPYAVANPTAEDKPPRLFIVLPAYNEGAALSQLTASFGPALPHRSFQILVVDDGSTDDSMSILESARVPHVDIIRHPQNKGLGEAVKTGFLVALERAHANDIIAVMDSDGTHSPYLIERMIQLIQEGNRRGGGLPLPLRLSGGRSGLVPHPAQPWLQLGFSPHHTHL